MDSNGKFVLGLLTGLGIGTALGLLMAPDKGSNTVKRLEDAIKDVSKDLQAYGNETLKKAKKAG